jgi:hypothetical protein
MCSLKIKDVPNEVREYICSLHHNFRFGNRNYGGQNFIDTYELDLKVEEDKYGHLVGIDFYVLIRICFLLSELGFKPTITLNNSSELR